MGNNVVFSPFLKGIGRAIDIYGTLTEYDYKDIANEVDKEAIYSDWAIVFNDLKIAYKKFETCSYEE